ncbi:hypothetical protein RISK_004256 [Rhodopirellula islandica]|uniref:Uncharacterized protein n=1 Tax=Rhodopirellula islandica TaxID=595434 RepID=A0A0J1EEC5_RHOIS|nr:hypothetical protein [Rhodopirellula islandica]KLU03849.1 hypothetical protein RISK_004256 [Rhodopirellula islandica]
MTPSQKLARARHCFQAWLNTQPAEDSPDTIQIRPSEPQAEWSESVFICDGFYRGRRFRTDSTSAIWFTEEDELKIHDEDGSCVETLSSAEMEAQFAAAQPQTDTAQTEPLRRAA